VKLKSLQRSITLGVGIGTLVVAACAAQGPTIRAQADPSANFGKYHTFAFYDEVSGTNVAYSSFIAKYLKQSISRQLGTRGFRHDPANPDLLVNFQVLAQDKLSVSQTPSGYYGYRRGLYGSWGGMTQTNVSTYKEGTLNIDVVDRASRQLVWEGVAVGQIRDKALDNPQPAIESVVTQVFARFPSAATATAGAEPTS
jgi:hypothetical protein